MHEGRPESLRPRPVKKRGPCGGTPRGPRTPARVRAQEAPTCAPARVDTPVHPTPLPPADALAGACALPPASPVQLDRRVPLPYPMGCSQTPRSLVLCEPRGHTLALGSDRPGLLVLPVSLACMELFCSPMKRGCYQVPLAVGRGIG